MLIMCGRQILSKIPHIFFHIFYTEMSMVIYQYKEKKLEAKLGYTQIMPIIIVDP